MNHRHNFNPISAHAVCHYGGSEDQFTVTRGAALRGHFGIFFECRHSSRYLPTHATLKLPLMNQSVSPAKSLNGVVILPGDKSISHRYGLLGGIANGVTTIHNYSTGADCQSTLGCMQALGAVVERRDDRLLIHGAALHQAAAQLDAGNSGSTIRMLSGMLSGQNFTSRIGGDESLSGRPMDRVIKPLTQMGARIEGTAIAGRNGNFPPLTIQGQRLHGIDYATPMASAQVKSCVLLAGLFAEGDTIVREAIQTRDHTEIALKDFGADVELAPRTITLHAGAKLEGREFMVPGDLSSAAFFLVAALLVPEADLIIRNVGLNPTRTALLDFLASIGASIKIIDVKQSGGELIGDLRVRGSNNGVKGGVIMGAQTAALIDEIPALSVLGAASEGGLTVRDAAELRVKETDRIATIETNMRRMGIQIESTPDGFHIPGKQKFHAAEIDPAGDHRIAMAFSVAALAADGPCTITEAECAGVSFPEFFATLQTIVG
jgi:3-phosphoshikimate 1-carboxyvinyltransferase